MNKPLILQGRANMSKYLYAIKKLNIKSWIKYWLEKRATQQSEIKLSDIITGTNFTLNGTIQNPFKIFNIRGNLIQDGEPSPNNEVPILSAGSNGSINEEIVNENLWSSEWEKGYIDTSGNNSYNANFVRTKDFIYFEPEKHYAIKRSIYTAYMNVRGYDINKNFVGAGGDVINLISGSSAGNPMNTQDTCVIATKPGVYYLRFCDASNDLSTKYMMVKGDTPADYVKSESQDISIPTQQPMRSIGDVRDEFVKVNGIWYERHNIGYKVLDGTEDNWSYTSTSQGSLFRNTNLLESIENKIPCSNYFKGRSSATNRQNGEFYYNYIAHSNHKTFDFMMNEFDNVDDFKNWLSTHNVEVQCILANPINLPCTQAQTEALENLKNLTTYPEQTNIMSTDKVSANLEIQYYERRN